MALKFRIERTHSGYMRISEFVTDGTDTWLHTELYEGYTQREACRLYSESIAGKGLVLA